MWKVILISDIGICELDRFNTYEEALAFFKALPAEDKDIANLTMV